LKALVSKRILVGVTGGIAAYKAAELVRQFKHQGAEVKVVMTEAATAFITPLTFQALTGEPVRMALFDEQAEAGMGHIELARWADWIIIAPATANILAKITAGIADDLLTTLVLAMRGQCMICPAMNIHMWHKAAVQENIAKLRQRNFHIVEPASGEQACGDVGVGRMAEAADICQNLINLCQPELLKGKNVLLTMGPTREYLDPVRFISNESSGLMGYSMAMAALQLGASVTVVTGPTEFTFHDALTVVPVISADEMFDAVKHHIATQDVFIATAAVGDYKPLEQNHQKMKKSQQPVSISLTENPDILAYVGQNHLCPLVVGFAAETNDVKEYALKKLQGKGAHLIVANQVGLTDSGFNSQYNEVTIYGHNDVVQSFPKLTKQALAVELMNYIAETMGQE
jgi:phosphopantothenoylcysteine decarboxylase/phosphopantothenate--cysteine ligase